MNPDDEKIIVFMTFDNPFEANLIKATLESNNINCFLRDENSRLIEHGSEVVNLCILESDFDRAKDILVDNHVIEPYSMKQRITCPNCLSVNIFDSQSLKDNRSGLQRFKDFFLSIYATNKSDKNYKCLDCGNEFKLRRL